jgi:hypothetical protein
LQQRDRRTSVIQPVSEQPADDEVTDLTERTEKTRTKWSSMIRDAF